MPPIVRRADDTDRPAWDAFVASRPEADLLQAWGGGAGTALAGEPPIRILVEDAGTVRGVGQVLMRSAGFGRKVAYLPHGPVWDRLPVGCAPACRGWPNFANGQGVAVGSSGLPIATTSPRSVPT